MNLARLHLPVGEVFFAHDADIPKHVDLILVSRLSRVRDGHLFVALHRNAGVVDYPLICEGHHTLNPLVITSTLNAVLIKGAGVWDDFIDHLTERLLALMNRCNLGLSSLLLNLLLDYLFFSS